MPKVVYLDKGHQTTGYSSEWQQRGTVVVNTSEIEFYVQKLKEHEAKRLSTNARNEFWKKHNQLVK